MSGIKVLALLQIMFRLIVAGEVIEEVTLPSIQNLSLAETNGSWVLPLGYEAFPEFGFAYKDSETELSYNDARKACLNDGGQLAVIDSREKVEKLIEKGFSSSWVGVGLGSYYQAEEWITIDGKSTNNLPWASGQPSGDHRCVYLSSVANGLNTWTCNDTWYALCEIALPKN